jgi:hypothetical protein
MSAQQEYILWSSFCDQDVSVIGAEYIPRLRLLKLSEGQQMYHGVPESALNGPRLGESGYIWSQANG